MWFSTFSMYGEECAFPRSASAARKSLLTFESRPGSGRQCLLRLLRAHFAERALVFGRENLHELTARCIPVFEQRLGTRRTGELEVTFDETLQQRFVRLAGMPKRAIHRALLFGLLQHGIERDHRL